MRGWTYAIQSQNGGPVKIGSTISAPVKRLAALQVGNPEVLEIVRLYEGVWNERNFHGMFRDYRLIGEWFEPRILEELPWPDEAVCESCARTGAFTDLDALIAAGQDTTNALSCFTAWRCMECRG